MEQMNNKILVWDIPTRAFHWLLVLAISFQFVTAEILDDAIQLHFYGGYFTLTLIVFRIFWGIWGSYHARFINFIVKPKTTYHYAKSLAFSDSPIHLGHNPLGALSIILVLTIIAMQAISGLFISDDIFSQGPYYYAVSSQTQDLANWIHHNTFNAIWVFLAFHIGAMIFYKVEKKQDLVKAMVTGYKPHTTDAPLIKNHWLRFILISLCSALLVYCVVVVWAPEAIEEFYY